MLGVEPQTLTITPPWQVRVCAKQSMSNHLPVGEILQTGCAGKKNCARKQNENMVY